MTINSRHDAVQEDPVRKLQARLVHPVGCTHLQLGVGWDQLGHLVGGCLTIVQCDLCQADEPAEHGVHCEGSKAAPSHMTGCDCCRRNAVPHVGAIPYTVSCYTRPKHAPRQHHQLYIVWKHSCQYIGAGKLLCGMPCTPPQCLAPEHAARQAATAHQPAHLHASPRPALQAVCVCTTTGSVLR